MDADVEPRSRSPKPEEADSQEDVDMIPLSDRLLSTTTDYARAMSVDVSGDRPPSTSFWNSWHIYISQGHFKHCRLTQTSCTAIPPIEEQVRIIKDLMGQLKHTPFQDGQEVYLISSKWLLQAMAIAEGKPATKDDPESPVALGPVDNSDIIEESFTDHFGLQFSSLKPGISQPEHFQYFTEEAWNRIICWHGLAPNQFPLVRVAHNTADEGENILVENYPPVLKLHRLWSAISTIPVEAHIKANNPPAPRIVMPAAHLFQDFLKRAKEILGIDLVRKVRVWRLPQQLPSGTATPVPGPQASWKMLVAVDDFTALEDGKERDRVTIKDETRNPKYNGKSTTLSLAGLATSVPVVLDEEVERGSHVSTYSPNQTNGIKGFKSTLALPGYASDSGRSSPALSGPITRGRAKKIIRSSRQSSGTRGLQNLGNTCYMNSALQCLRHVEELTKYFLTQEAEKEINTTNVLGHNGDVARAYGRLLAEFYSETGPGYITPRSFKSIIGRYAPMFSGYGQQDSQEFLGFLLDALQEDLSRIKKKPYIEKPDSTDEMINNPVLTAEMAQEVWDITKRRDDSVVADLFVGMYKSTLRCPDCSKVSITFDPFNNLTLQLPVNRALRRSVRFFPLNDTPVNINIEVDRNGSVRELKDFVSLRVGVSSDRLVVAENFGHKFYTVYADYQGPLHEKMQPNDLIDVFELQHKPTNWPDPRPAQEKKLKGGSYISYLTNDDETGNTSPRWDHPMSEFLLVPVIYRRIGRNVNFGVKRAAVDPPHFIVLTRDEARSEDIIRRKLLQKLATFSKWEGFHTDPEGESAGSTEAEMIASGISSDGASSESNKVQAKSVDGEEDMVDISMEEKLTRADSNTRLVWNF